MKKRLIKTTVMLMAMIALFSMFAITSNATDYGNSTYTPSDPGTNVTYSFSAGNKGYTTSTSSSGSDGKYDVFLSSFSFISQPTNTMPSTWKIYFYPTPNKSVCAAQEIAGFSRRNRGYSYNYKSSYSGSGISYYLAAYSNSPLGATVTVHWHA